MPLFDIPTDRLLELTDADLRELVARLCEAERERQGGHRNEVRWGGSQTAADGGLDVVVEPARPFIAAGPLVRHDVGIQVKAADYAPAAITAEMQYGGSLRPAISLLAEKSGSYLIASVGANCSEAMLQRRVNAMRDSAMDDPNGAALHLAFLDRNAISRWISAHPSVVGWLRTRLTLPTLEGWQPLGRWSSTPEGEDDNLICEKGLTFYIEQRDPIRNLPEALDEIRKLVRDGTGAVRIAGLSGIGKSRIVQALFEPVGDVEAFAASHAIYTDLGHAPKPAPMGMLEALLARNAPAVLVIDNCPPETHQALARKLAEQPGPVHIISVEYDVRTDRPEETDVIRIEAESPEIVEALLHRRHSELSSGDAHRLAELAQGNARLAFALAQAAPHTGTLSTFDNSTLFDRLFWQREERNDELARAAEILSLVYSFEVESEAEPDELAFLGSLAELSRGAMHRHAATLLARGLAQARSRWRAVLPHALANRLARQALRSIPLRMLAESFSDKIRLRRSLARRLSYLHDSEEARRIVTQWMEAGGPLHGSTPDIQVLEAACHLVPEEALKVVDSMIAALGTTPEDFHLIDSLIRMISRIAHSEAIFPQACGRLATLAIMLDGQRASNAGDALNSLFGLYLSGTLAKTRTRILVARQYLLAGDPNQNALGISMLRAALRTGNWSSAILSFDDARPDPLGWEPRGHEVVEWFSGWLDLASEIASHAPPYITVNIRKALADEIDGVWRRVPSLRPRINEITRELHASAPWAEGRHTLKQMIYFIRSSGEQFPTNDIENVLQLIDDTEPRDLEARVRAEQVMGWDFYLEGDDADLTAEARRDQRLELLGRELAADHNSLRALGRDLLTVESGNFYKLGAGLAQGANYPLDLWGFLRDLHLIDPSKTRQASLLAGFIQELDNLNPTVAAEIRNECRATPALRKEYGIFLPRGVLQGEELEHVIEIATEPNTPAWQFSDVSWREERELNDESRIRLLRAIIAKPDGPEQVINALIMLQHVEKSARNSWPEDLRRVGLDAIIRIIGTEKLNANNDERTARALTACLRGDDGSDASRIMEIIMDRVAKRYGITYDVERMLSSLANSSPETFLSRVFSGDSNEPRLIFQGGLHSNPLSHVPIEFLIAWCRAVPDRWALVSPHIPPFSSRVNDDSEAGPISPFAIAFFNAAPRPEEVVESYFQHLSPMSWSGSRADTMERRLVAIESLNDHPNPEVGRTIARLAPNIRFQIDRIRQAEQKEERERDERFE